MNPDVGDELDAHAQIREIVEDVGQRIAAIVEPATPTASLLASLGDELNTASADPSSVPHPELVDPDAYWEAAVKPQSPGVVRS